jgi:hypothetical protein
MRVGLIGRKVAGAVMPDVEKVGRRFRRSYKAEIRIAHAGRERA